MFQNVLCIQMHCLRIIYHEFMNNLLSYYSFRMMHWLDAWKYWPKFLFQRLGCLKEYLVFFKWALFMFIRSLCYVANSKISLEKRSFEPRLKTCYVQMTQIKFLVCMRNDAQFRNKGLKVHGVFLFFCRSCFCFPPLREEILFQGLFTQNWPRRSWTGVHWGGSV